MTLRTDVVAALTALGFRNTLNPVARDGDYLVRQDATGTVVLDWFSAQPQPSEATINAVTQAQIDAATASRLSTAEPDLTTLRSQAAQAVTDINTFLAIASPSNAQLAAEVRAIDQRQRAIIKALDRLAARVLA